MLLGFVSYLNALPFNAAFRLNKIDCPATIIYDTPSKLNAMLKNGELDIALTSSVVALDEEYDTLPDFCIASRGPIYSVNLYLKEEMPLNNATIGVTAQSATGAALLKLLCHHHWEVSPEFVPLELPFNRYDGFLLIGDEALAKDQIPGYQRIDLGEAWDEMTSLPFVYALFSIRKGVAEEQVEAISQSLHTAYNWWQENDQISLATSLSSIPEKVIRNYYQVCHYHLGEQEKKGLECFEKYRNLSPILA